MAALPDPTVPVKFPNWARLVLGLIVGFLGYLVAGELTVSEELRGAIAAIVALLASAGIVPPKPEDLPRISTNLRFVLTALVTGGVYALNVVALEPTLRGVLVAVLTLAASLGVVPPQARR